MLCCNIGIYLIKRFKFLQKYKKIYSVISISLPVALSTFIVLISAFFNNDSAFFSKFNRILSGRLALGNYAIKQYGFELFARHIIFAGGEIKDSSITYNFVDSSYLLYLINFGIIFLVLLIVLLTYFAHLINTKKDVYMFMIFCIITLHSTFDPQLLNLCFNYFLMVWSYKNTKIKISHG